MLRLIGFCLRICFFSIFILVLGNTLHWEGRTVSDQVKIKMSHAERSPIVGIVRVWAEKITRDARKGILKKAESLKSSSDDSAQEELPSSERQKLKALIQELNSVQ